MPQVCDEYGYSPNDRPMLGGVAWDDVQTAVERQRQRAYCQSILLGPGIANAESSRSLRWANEHWDAVADQLVTRRLGDDDQELAGVEAVGEQVGVETIWTRQAKWRGVRGVRCTAARSARLGGRQSCTPPCPGEAGATCVGWAVGTHHTGNWVLAALRSRFFVLRTEL